MDVYTSRFRLSYEYLKATKVVRHNKLGESTLQMVFDEYQFVAIYFYHDRSMLCQSFNEQLYKFMGNEAEVLKNTAVLSAASCATNSAPKALLAVVCVVPSDGTMSQEPLPSSLSWFSLDVGASFAKVKLMRLFHVRRVPCLTLVRTSSMEVCSIDCCSEVQNDPTGLRFPWCPKSLLESCTGSLLSKDGSVTDFANLPKGVRGFLFAAQWCPPCRSFVQRLKETYRRIRASSQTFDVIFCSHDRSPLGFQRFYDDMPWLAIPYGDDRSLMISKALCVQEIPSLLILDEDFKLLNRHGKLEVHLDAMGKEFPWHPRSIIELTERTASRLRDDVAVILFNLLQYFLEGSIEDLTFAQNFLLPIAEEHFQEQTEPEIIFFYAAEESINDRILEVFGLNDLPLPLVCISDPFSESIYVCDHPNVSEDIIRQFLTKFKQDELTPIPYPKSKFASFALR
ncbi:nucleoredoxin [Trichuris trichiura]|uniref:Nucleoredoxin n=1 Tax=Trichuris trichiura TaxID=36087 RepID=A0A077ZEJ3_TRITR|nr:nucleoredoxin [Trichuris trichiura]